VVARGGALDNPAPRSARGNGAAHEPAAAKAAATRLAQCDHFLVAASAVTTFVRNPFPRAERGAGLSSAPPRATVFDVKIASISSQPLRMNHAVAGNAILAISSTR
jgi:hypothetical protein